MISSVASAKTRTETVKGFTKQFKLDRPASYENYGDVRDAITREKNQRLAPGEEK